MLEEAEGVRGTDRRDRASQRIDQTREARLLKINGSTAGVDYHATFGDFKERGLAAGDFFLRGVRTPLLSP